VTAGTTAVVVVPGAFVPLATLAEMVSIGTLSAFFVVSLAVAILRRTKPRMPRPFHTPQVPLLPIVSALLCLGLMANLAMETWLRFIIWLVIGLAIYFFYGRKHSRLEPPARRRRRLLAADGRRPGDGVERHMAPDPEPGTEPIGIGLILR
jgi:APA family basic amino acid/polyamine antiporter